MEEGRFMFLQVSVNTNSQSALFIFSGQFDPKGIRCSTLALEETKRLLHQYQTQIETRMKERQSHWMISYLNVRSLYAHNHDVARDNILMMSDVFCLGETWLHHGSRVHFEGFVDFHATFGPGKGLSTYVKNQLLTDPIASSSEYLSISKLSLFQIDMIFVYVSNQCNKELLIAKLNQLINIKKPTVIIGDFNENYSEASQIANNLKALDFNQMIQEPTHDKGNTIDHIYVNTLLKKKGIFYEKNPTYYSDHDIISLYVSK